MKEQGLNINLILLEWGS